jgi:hypothetical protein
MTFVHARHETTAPAKSVAWVSTTEELVGLSGPIGSNGADGGKGCDGTMSGGTVRSGDAIVNNFTLAKLS